MACSNLARTHLIYCIKPNKNEYWQAYNRNYKSIGEPFKFARKLQEKTIRFLDGVGNGNVEKGIWFYHDGSYPGSDEQNTQTYFKRIAKLTSLIITNDGF